MEVKYCPQCDITKPVELFWPDKNNKWGGRRSWCIECSKKKAKEKRENQYAVIHAYEIKSRRKRRETGKTKDHYNKNTGKTFNLT